MGSRNRRRPRAGRGSSPAAWLRERLALRGLFVLSSSASGPASAISTRRRYRAYWIRTVRAATPVFSPQRTLPGQRTVTGSASREWTPAPRAAMAQARFPPVAWTEAVGDPAAEQRLQMVPRTLRRERPVLTEASPSRAPTRAMQRPEEQMAPAVNLMCPWPAMALGNLAR
jgi:hypothetical protein